MKAIVIAGNVGKDAVLRTTQQGDKVLGFGVAVDDGWGENKRTLWFDVSIWGNRAEKLAPHIKRGSRISVSGDLSTREHEGKTYLTVRANEITLQGGERQGGADRRGDETQRGGSYGGGAKRPASADLDEDSIPFAPEVR